MKDEPVGLPDPRGPEELAAGARLEAAWAEARRRAEARSFWEAVDARRARSGEPSDVVVALCGSVDQARRAIVALGEAFGRNCDLHHGSGRQGRAL